MLGALLILKSRNLLNPRGEWIVESAKGNGRMVKAKRVSECDIVFWFSKIKYFYYVNLDNT